MFWNDRVGLAPRLECGGRAKRRHRFGFTDQTGSYQCISSSHPTPCPKALKTLPAQLRHSSHPSMFPPRQRRRRLSPMRMIPNHRPAPRRMRVFRNAHPRHLTDHLTRTRIADVRVLRRALLYRLTTSNTNPWKYTHILPVFKIRDGTKSVQHHCLAPPPTPEISYS